MFHQLPIGNPEDVDAHDVNLLARRRDAHDGPLVGALIADAGYHLVSIGEQVLHSGSHVGEGTQVQAEELVRLLGQPRRYGMVDRVGGEELAEGSQVPLINDCIEELLNKRFVIYG